MSTEEYGEDRGENGKFKPGNRAASARGGNKISTKVKESIVNFLERNVDAIQDSFDELVLLLSISYSIRYTCSAY